MTSEKLHHLIQHEILNERIAIESESFRPYGTFRLGEIAMCIIVPMPSIRRNGLNGKPITQTFENDVVTAVDTALPLLVICSAILFARMKISSMSSS
jgi:hypothetical protein